MKMAPIKANEVPSGVTRAIGIFSSKFYKVVTEEFENGGNIVSSPLSIHLLLSCLYDGADHLTAYEMAVGLDLVKPTIVHAEYKNLIFALQKIPNDPYLYRYECPNDVPSMVNLSLANGIFFKEDTPLSGSFEKRSKYFYNIDLQKVDFHDRVKSSRTINDWVSKNTKNNITNIISSDCIDAMTKVVLVNAIYLKAKWSEPFSMCDTMTRTFYVKETLTKEVQMMYKNWSYNYGELPSIDSTFVTLPYENGDLDMIIILPNSIGLKHAETNFDWNTIVNTEAKRTEIDLYLPKFKVDGEIDMKRILGTLGMKSMFHSRGDFDRITSSRLRPPLYVAAVIQKAYLDVNESGTEAAAVTLARLRGGGGPPIELPQQFVVNRPFIVAIRHVPTNIPIFISSIRDIGINPREIPRTSIGKRFSARLFAKRNECN